MWSVQHEAIASHPRQSVLVCPVCGERPAFQSLKAECVLARCACRELPLAFGVLVPDAGPLQSALVAAIRAGDRARARDLILDRHARKARLLRMLRIRPTFEQFVRHRLISELVNWLDLRPLLEKLPPKRIMQTIAAAAQWNIYIRHRFSAPPMLSITTLFGLLRDRAGLVLDAPCGMGHLSFLISKLFPARRLVCMDLEPAFVYSARRFFVPGAAAAIVHDMNHPLPLASEAFGAIFCADAFHYVENRAGLAREFMRVLHDNGICVLAHVHNSLRHTSYAGQPLSPREYASLFAGCHVRIFPETYLVDAYLDNRPLDLTRRFTEQELNSHRVLDVIAAKSPGAFAVVPPSRDALIAAARNPRVSGLYEARGSGDDIVYQRNIPEGLRAEYAQFREILPRIVSFPFKSITSRNGRPHFENQRELLEKHVLVDVPEDY